VVYLSYDVSYYMVKQATSLIMITTTTTKLLLNKKHRVPLRIHPSIYQCMFISHSTIDLRNKTSVPVCYR